MPFKTHRKLWKSYSKLRPTQNQAIIFTTLSSKRPPGILIFQNQ